MYLNKILKQLNIKQKGKNRKRKKRGGEDAFPDDSEKNAATNQKKKWWENCSWDELQAEIVRQEEEFKQKYGGEQARKRHKLAAEHRKEKRKHTHTVVKNR